MSTDRFEEVRRRHARAEEGGGAERKERQHAEGKLSARERVAQLLDEGTFEELDKLVRHRSQNFGMQNTVIDGDGFVTGHGLIHGRPVFVFAQDFTVFGGSLSESNAQKIVKVMDLAKTRQPDQKPATPLSPSLADFMVRNGLGRTRHRILPITTHAKIDTNA